MRSGSNGELSVMQDCLMNNGDGAMGKTTATTELMDQLSALRKRLEGEQKRVDSQLKAGSAQYSKLADQSRRRKEQTNRVEEADDVVGQVLAQLREVQTDVGSDVPAYEPDDVIGAVFVKDGAQASPPPDEGVLSAFNKIKYNKGEQARNGPSAQTALMHAFPEPPASEGALDTQQRALIQAQERELELLRGRLGATTQLDRNGTLASLASTGSFNLDVVTAKNEERLRRLNATGGVGTGAGGGAGGASDILASFLNESATRGLGSTFAQTTNRTKKYNPLEVEPLPAESVYH
jgi:hypothetical protein